LATCRPRAVHASRVVPRGALMVSKHSTETNARKRHELLHALRRKAEEAQQVSQDAAQAALERAQAWKLPVQGEQQPSS